MEEVFVGGEEKKLSEGVLTERHHVSSPLQFFFVYCSPNKCLNALRNLTSLSRWDLSPFSDNVQSYCLLGAFIDNCYSRQMGRWQDSAGFDALTG